MHREPRRWRTRFGRWVRRVGVGELTVRLAAAGQPVTRKAVYNWLAGTHQPRPSLARIVVGMSAGAVRLDDIYRQAVQIRSDQRSTPPPNSS